MATSNPNQSQRLGPTPDWLLERLAAGDLPGEEASRLRDRLEAEPGGAERLEAIAASNREILAAHPTARVAAAIRHRAEKQGRKRSLGLALGLVAPAAAALALILIHPTSTPIDRGTESIRLKGEQPHLLIHRKREGDPERLAAGAAARAHDLLQLSYVAAGDAYGVVISVDGNGTVTQHLPDAGATAAPLDPDGAVALPQSYELDDAPAFERFYLVTSDRPFPVDGILAAARALRPGAEELPLPAGLHQTSFLLRKVP